MRGRRRHHKRYDYLTIALWIASNPDKIDRHLARAIKNYVRFGARKTKRSATDYPRNFRRMCVECEPHLKRRMLASGDRCTSCRLSEPMGFPRCLCSSERAGTCAVACVVWNSDTKSTSPCASIWTKTKLHISAGCVMVGWSSYDARRTT